jgi:opacity protein-like surface antigen
MKRYCFLWVSVLFLSSAAMAEDGKWQIGVKPGYAILVGDINDSFKNSFRIEGSADYQISESMLGGLALAYSFGHKLEGSFSHRDIDGDGINDSNVGFNSNSKTSVLQLTPTMKIGHVNSGKPFLSFGAGLYRIHLNEGTATLSGRSSRGTNAAGALVAVDEETHNYFGVNGGIGILLRLQQGLGIGANISFHRAFSPEGNIKYFTPTLEFNLAF